MRNKPHSVQPAEIYGQVTVLRSLELVDKHRNKFYECKCSCGKVFTVRGVSLRNGLTQSCGCLKISLRQLPAGVAAWNRYFKAYLRGACNRNLECTLTLEQFQELAAGLCYYCGTPPKEINHYIVENSKTIRTESINRATIQANGVDRVDNNLGYILENCVPCCQTCNLMKLDHSRDAFITHAIKVAQHLGSKK